MIRFCENLFKIQNNIFKKCIIQFAFAKCNVWLIDYIKCITQLQKFVPDMQKNNWKNDFLFLISRLTSIFNLKLFRFYSTTLHKVEIELNRWKTKIDILMPWSNSARKKKFESIYELYASNYCWISFQKLQIENSSQTTAW